MRLYYFNASTTDIGVTNVSQQESLNEFILPNSPGLTSTEPPTSTLQNLLTNNYMPIKGNSEDIFLRLFLFHFETSNFSQSYQTMLICNML